MMFVQVHSYNYQYIMDSLPSTSQLGLEYTTLPIGFGEVTDGYYIRVVAVESNTWVSYPENLETEWINRGEYFEGQITNGQRVTKVSDVTGD